MGERLGYAVLEVGGIQRFILGAGKLREMIGGSELIESLSKNMFEDFCERRKLAILRPGDKDRPDDARPPRAGEVLPLQRNAGAMHLLFASKEAGREFVRGFCLEILADHPGLPLFAALRECAWERTDLARARRELSDDIARRRGRAPVAEGMSLQPVCRVARLDGLPAVKVDGDEELFENDRKELISVPSRTRRNRNLIDAANDRLRQADTHKVLPEAWLEKWSDDLSDLAGPDGKIAFIHMDGNDLGKLFRAALDRVSGKGPEESAREMCGLSALVENVTRGAFQHALRTLWSFELSRSVTCTHMPARPLVLGGDDVTAVVRADLALLFVDAFIERFESASAEAFAKLGQEGRRLSAGVGMVVAHAGYPFLRAFDLAEALLKRAKSLTAAMDPRPSSMDYVVLTSDAEADPDDLRRRTAAADDKAQLTARPILLEAGSLRNLLLEGGMVLDRLPRSAVRPAIDACRLGEHEGRPAWERLRRNIERGMGGRHDRKLLTLPEFDSLFPGGFFFTGKDGARRTRLGDHLELEHLRPHPAEHFTDFFTEGSKQS